VTKGYFPTNHQEVAKIDQKGAGEDGQREQRLSQVMKEVDNYFNGGEAELSGFAFERIKEVAGNDEGIINKAYYDACEKYGENPTNHLFGRLSDKLVRSMQQFTKAPG